MPELDVEEVLRDLPRPSFKARLKETLMQQQTVTPYITTKDVDELAAFVKETFGAEELVRAKGSTGGTHYSLRIGDALLMMGGGEALQHPPMLTALHFYVPDVDALYRRAVDAGAKSLMPPTDQSYGDRDCSIEDLAGNQWYLATSKGAHYKPDDLRSVTLFLHPYGAADLIGFMKRAIGAEVLEQHADAEGKLLHGKVQVGNTIIEMGEAHGEWTPMPTMIYCVVDDADAAYERAMGEGAKSVMAPTEQAYAPRTAAIEDPAGNQWYFAEPATPGRTAKSPKQRRK